MKFDSLKIDERILKATKEMGFEHCTPVQEQSLPDCIAGLDIISQSQTGTGKTAVFLITALNRLISDNLEQGRQPRALVLVPTRELATQVSNEADKLSKHLPLRSIAIYGGVDYDKQIKPLNEGVDIIVATPGRLMDLYKSKAFSLESIEIFIIDEADRMFDMGFAPDVRYIAGRLSKDKDRQTLLFSATIDYNVKSLASRYMKPDPVLVEIEPESVTVDAIEQKVLYVSNEEKLGVLMGLLKRPDTLKTIIFINMKRTAEMLEWKLKENGFEASLLTGDVSQSKRERIMASMKAGKVNILIATDVAARGVHIDDVTHVINYDLPDDPANYVHRIGRTARAGKKGKAYSLGCEDSVFNLPAIEEYIERKLDKEWLDEDEIVKDKAGRYRKPRPRTTGPGTTHSKSRSTGQTRGFGGKSKPGSKTNRPAKSSSARKRPFSKTTPTKSSAQLSTSSSEKASTGTHSSESGTNDPKKRPSTAQARRPANRPSRSNTTTGQRRTGSNAPASTKVPKAAGAGKESKQRESGTATEKSRQRVSGRATNADLKSSSSDSRLDFYNTARQIKPGSKNRDETKSTGAVEKKKSAEVKTEGLIKRVLKSFWKK